tara:strand:+ start:242 stop:1012 length:771 start_codon:yes stop_codon:yes gene_type:complete
VTLNHQKRALSYKAKENLLINKVILVSGAGDGIGREAALCYAKHGATVVLLGRTVEKLEAVYDEIELLGYPQAGIYPLDFSTAANQNYVAVRTQLESEFGILDGILHNASILGDRKPIASTSPNRWMEVMQINVNSSFMLTQALLPLLEKALDGSIIFTSSGVGRRAKAYWGAYAVSKFATEGLMEVLADELEKTSSIRVNSLNPGATNTAMRRTAYPGENPISNPCPIDIMAAYLYLMGPDSRGLTGEKLDAQSK